MAWGQEKGADVKISALRACQYEIFDFVPCSLPLKTLILLTFSCFLIRRRGSKTALFCYSLRRIPGCEQSGCKGKLQVVAAAIAIHIEDFAAGI